MRSAAWVSTGFRLSAVERHSEAATAGMMGSGAGAGEP